MADAASVPPTHHHQHAVVRSTPRQRHVAGVAAGAPSTALVDVDVEQHRRQPIGARMQRLVREIGVLKRQSAAMRSAITIIAHEMLRNEFAVRQARWLFGFHAALIVTLLLMSIFLSHEVPATVKLFVSLPSIVLTALLVLLLGVRNWMLPALRALSAASAFISLTMLVHRILLITLAREHPSLWWDIVLVVLQALDTLVTVLYFHTFDQIGAARGRVSAQLAKLEQAQLVANPVAVHRRTGASAAAAAKTAPAPRLRHSLGARLCFWLWALFDPHAILQRRADNRRRKTARRRLADDDDGGGDSAAETLPLNTGVAAPTNKHE
jgi:hypothetical protein